MADMLVRQGRGSDQEEEEEEKEEEEGWTAQRGCEEGNDVAERAGLIYAALAIQPSSFPPSSMLVPRCGDGSLSYGRAHAIAASMVISRQTAVVPGQTPSASMTGWDEVGSGT